VTLGPAVTNPVTRHPSVTASAIITVDQLSEGRAVLGISIGDSAVHQAGLRPARLDELQRAVGNIRSLIGGEDVDWGKVAIRPGWEGRAVPIYLAASGPKALRLAGALADGVLVAVGMNQLFYRWALEQIHAGAEASGRDVSAIRIVKKIHFCTHDNREVAINQVRRLVANGLNFMWRLAREVPGAEAEGWSGEYLDKFMAAFDHARRGEIDADHVKMVTDDLVEQVALAGTPSECVEKLQAMAEAGVTDIHFVLQPGIEEQVLELFSKRILPALK
jgi:5,10-methylenetetrahydromethanopterin reductase